MAYDNNLRGVLFKNKKKQEQNQPDYRGDCEIGGNKYSISAWVKESGPQSRNPGEKFMSLAFSIQDTDGINQDRSSPVARPPARAPAATEDDQVPF